jgi:hypothetical protein
MKNDIVICAMPALFVDRLPGAPALLKAAVETAGYCARAVDLSLNFFLKQCDGNVDRYNQLGSVFRPGETADSASTTAAESWVKDSIDIIRQSNAPVVGLSVFTNFQHRSTVRLARAIRDQLPEVKIILGGWGLTVPCQSLSSDEPRSRELIKQFSQYMTDLRLCDYTIFGSGLDELISVLQKELGPNTVKIDYAEQNQVIYNTPIPNYDEYRLDQYVWNQAIALPVTGSKGCVRACTFCDIPGQFGRFKYRTGADIANEMIYLRNKYNVRIFEFTDSLVNGSLKAFREWLTLIADYNQGRDKEDQIQWFGQYICRPQAHTPKDIYSLMAKSGVANLVIGVESGSDEVLKAMNKKMTVQDAFDEFEQFEQHGIQTHVLMFGGFYNETWDRYLKSLDFIVRCQRYLTTGTISKLSMGPPLFINNKMYLGEQADQLGILLDPTDEMGWVSAEDPDNDFVERCRRRLIAQLVLDRLNIPLSGQSISNLYQIRERLKKIAGSTTRAQCQDQRDLDFLIPETIVEKINNKKLELHIEFLANIGANWPKVKLYINDQVVADKEIANTNSIDYSGVISGTTARVKLEYYGKTAADTEVDAAGQILSNQSILITKIILNDVDLVKHNMYQYLGEYHMYLDEQKLKYYNEHGYFTGPTKNLQMFENGYWQFEFQLPILANLIPLTAQQEKHEKWPDPELLFEIYGTISNIKGAKHANNQ